MRKWISLSGLSFTSMLLFASAIDPAEAKWPVPLLLCMLSLLAFCFCQKQLPDSFWEEDLHDDGIFWEEEGF